MEMEAVVFFLVVVILVMVSLSVASSFVSSTRYTVVSSLAVTLKV